MATNVSFFVRQDSKSDSVQPTLEVEEFYDDSLTVHAYYDKNDEYNYVVVDLDFKDLCELSNFLNDQVDKYLMKHVEIKQAD